MRPTKQIFRTIVDGALIEVPVPSASSHILPGIPWGAFDEIATPAYWSVQAWLHSRLGTYSELRLGRSLSEELTACLLGGYGMPAYLGLAAYQRLREEKLIFSGVTPEQIECALSEPFAFSSGMRRYRFAKQKARYLSQCLSMMDEIEGADRQSDVELRNSLISFPGIGPKTASWIVRNYKGSDQVAIIDVHILKAGRLIGLYQETENPQQHYLSLEQRFLDLAAAMKVRAAMLDALIWDQMRHISPTLRRSVKRSKQIGSKNLSAEQGGAATDQLALCV